MRIGDSTEISVALDKFSTYLFSKCGASQVTVSNNVGVIRRAARELGVNPTEEQVQKYVAKLAMRGCSISHRTNTAVAFEKYMKFIGRPIKLGRPRKEYTLPKGALTVAEVTGLIAEARNLREKAMLVTLAYTGLRNKELCNLKIGDLDLERKTLCVRGSKIARSRVLPLPDDCAAVLGEYFKERKGSFNEFLFVTKREGIYYEPQCLRKMIRERAREAGIRKRVYPHLLRHSLATNLAQSGTGVLAIKQQLGHEYLSSTMRYVHSDPQWLKQEFLLRVPKYLPTESEEENGKPKDRKRARETGIDQTIPLFPL